MKTPILSGFLLATAASTASLFGCGLKTSSSDTVVQGGGCLTLCSPMPAPPEPLPQKSRSPRPTQGSINGIAFTEGALSLVPDHFGVEGSVQYRIFETGLVVYQGSVSYFGTLSSIGGRRIFRQTFQGSYQAKPETVAVKSFWNEGHTFNDYKTQFIVGHRGDSNLVVSAAAPSEGATATFEIDALVNPIAINRAEVKGKVFGVEVTLTALPTLSRLQRR